VSNTNPIDVKIMIIVGVIATEKINGSLIQFEWLMNEIKCRILFINISGNQIKNSVIKMKIAK